MNSYISLEMAAIFFSLFVLIRQTGVGEGAVAARAPFYKGVGAGAAGTCAPALSKKGTHTWVCTPTFGQTKCSNFAKYLLIFCSLKCKIVNNNKHWLASLANFTILLFYKFS